MCKLLVTLALLTASLPGQAQQAPAPGPAPAANPLPDMRQLILDLEANEKSIEAKQKDYTYHIHLEEQEFNGGGAVKKTTVTDSESLTIDGVRVDRVVARDGKPLSPDDAKKESDRLDKDVAKAKGPGAAGTSAWSSTCG